MGLPKFWPIIHSLNKINKKSESNQLRHMSFRIYTKNYLMIKPELKSKLSSIDDFIFKGGDKTFFRLSNNEAGY